MKYEQFRKKVEEIKINRPIWFGLESDPEATEAEIEEAEAILNIFFPEEYKKFVKLYGGGYFAFTNVYSVSKNSDWYIVDRNLEVGLLDSIGFLVISDNGVGDYYGFKVIDGRCNSMIYLFDHNDHRVKSTQYDDFYEYLIRVGLEPR